MTRSAWLGTLAILVFMLFIACTEAPGEVTYDSDEDNYVVKDIGCVDGGVRGYFTSAGFNHSSSLELVRDETC